LDVWNEFDIAEGDGTLTDLRWADGRECSPVRVMLVNAPGCWSMDCCLGLVVWVINSVTYSENHAASARVGSVWSFWTNSRNSTRVNFHSNGLATCS
jgi:hypothetical protein